MASCNLDGPGKWLGTGDSRPGLLAVAGPPTPREQQRGPSKGCGGALLGTGSKSRSGTCLGDPTGTLLVQLGRPKRGQEWPKTSATGPRLCGARGTVPTMPR